MSFFDTITQKLPVALDFIIEVRGLLADLKSVYDMRQKQAQMQSGVENAQQNKDTSGIEKAFQQSGPQAAQVAQSANASAAAPVAPKQ